MRISLFVSALFALSLSGGAAMADRPGDDGGARTRVPHVREMRVREARQVNEARVRDRPEPRVRDPRVNERLRSRGDLVDHSGGRGAKGSQSDPHGVRTPRAAATPVRRVNDKQVAQHNCAPNDDSCSGGARSARALNQAATERAQKQQRNDVQKVVDKIRAEKLRAKIMKQICERHATTCTDTL